jgi:hypothetical protein
VEPTDEPAAPEADDPEEQDTGKARYGLELQVEGGVLFEVLAETVASLALGAELGLGETQRWRVGLEALVSSQTDVRLEGGRSRSRLVAGRALGCRRWPIGELGLDSCLGLAAGAARAGGKEFPVPQLQTTLAWVAPLARVGLSYPRAGMFGLRLTLDAYVHAVRPGLRVHGPRGEVLGEAKAGVFGAGGSLALIIRLQ